MPIPFIISRRKLISVGAFAVIALAIMFFEIAAYQHEGQYSMIASRLWLLSAALFFIVGFIHTAKAFLSSIRKKEWACIIALLLITILTGINIERFPEDISGESTVQVAAGLSAWKQPDLGYTQTAFLGNPSRQFLLVSIPALLGGRYIVTYRLGYWLAFIIGVYLFYAGMHLFFEKRSETSRIVSLTLLGILSFPVLPLLLRTFEQITLPISFAFSALGMLLITIKKPGTLNGIALMWICGMLFTSYVPSLAAGVLILTLILETSMVYLAQKRWIPALIFLGCAATILTIGVSAGKTRTDMKLPETQTISYQDSAEKIKQAFIYFFWENTDMYSLHVPFIGKIIYLPLVVYCMGAIFLFWGWKHAFLAVWIIGIIITAGLSPGYARPLVAFGIHRAIIVIPFLIFGITDVLIKNHITVSRRIFLCLFLLFSFFNIITVIELYEGWKPTTDPRTLTLKNLLKSVQPHQNMTEEPIRIAEYMMEPSHELRVDQLIYFFPGYKLIISQDCPNIDSIDPYQITVVDSSQCQAFIDAVSRIPSFTVNSYRHEEKNYTYAIVFKSV